VLEARFDALQRQINPHFLFNTLNSIAVAGPLPAGDGEGDDCAIGQHPARPAQGSRCVCAFREELSFTDDYLGIEVVRFGAEKLRVVKEIDPETLELLVPCVAAAAADRKQHQAWAGTAPAGRHHHPAQPHPGDQADR